MGLFFPLFFPCRQRSTDHGRGVCAELAARSGSSRERRLRVAAQRGAQRHPHGHGVWRRGALRQPAVAAAVAAPGPGPGAPGWCSSTRWQRQAAAGGGRSGVSGSKKRRLDAIRARLCRCSLSQAARGDIAGGAAVFRVDATYVGRWWGDAAAAGCERLGSHVLNDKVTNSFWRDPASVFRGAGRRRLAD